MSAADAFADTNVLLSLLGEDDRKADVARRVLGNGVTISVQVLNEFAAVTLRKKALSWSELNDVLGVFRASCTVWPLTLETHECGVAVAERYRLHIYDAMILAAAADAGCRTLWSEDMQDGQTIAGVTIRNPFVL